MGWALLNSGIFAYLRVQFHGDAAVHSATTKPASSKSARTSRHIAKMFSSANFKVPMLIHDTDPPSIATMTRLKEQIRYELSETERGHEFGWSRAVRKPRTPCTPSCSFKLSPAN
jgi:hypothetical protein